MRGEVEADRRDQRYAMIQASGSSTYVVHQNWQLRFGEKTSIMS